ncbi:MAG TPA: hypothetical protein VFS75_00210 [Candidatus Paceibacterota bacterium]|nr:hypothetical protein [Candidatus Paceibacterota bacterium]
MANDFVCARCGRTRADHETDTESSNCAGYEPSANEREAADIETRQVFSEIKASTVWIT